MYSVICIIDSSKDKFVLKTDLQLQEIDMETFAIFFIARYLH